VTAFNTLFLDWNYLVPFYKAAIKNFACLASFAWGIFVNIPGYRDEAPTRLSNIRAICHKS
jgi:hypothetical protein